jgi:hypothetical protein
MTEGSGQSMQMIWITGDEKRVLELVDTPELVLVQFCNSILRHQDLRNPDARRMLRETVDALKVKAGQEPDSPLAMDRFELKEKLVEIEEALDKFDEKQDDGNGE